MAEASGPAGDKPSEAESESESKPELASEQIGRMLEEMHLRLCPGLKETEKEAPKQVLGTIDVQGLAKFIKEGKAKNIVTMAGAGISTAAGIPDFRSPGTGLYDNLGEYNLPDPMAIFAIDFFQEEPAPFFKISKALLPDKFKPTYTHYMLRLLHDKGLLKRHYTQNIDMLEDKAGLPEEKVIYAHGNFKTGHCLACRRQYDFEWMRELVLADKIPKCEQANCGATVKPDIVFFGESLPARFANNVEPDFSSADLLLIFGTSLVVMPFAALVDKVKDEVPRAYFNRELGEGAVSDWLALLTGIKTGLQCNAEDNYRDVFVKGDCDAGCLKLAELLGWKAELEALYKEGHAEEEKPGASGDAQKTDAKSAS